MPIHGDIIVELQRRSVDKASTELERKFGSFSANVGVDVKAAEVKAAAAKIQQEFKGLRAEVKIDVDRRGLANVNRELNNTQNIVHQIGQAAFRTSRGIMAIGAPIALKGLFDLASVAVTASQSIALLPAAIGAVGAAYGTLQLATAGVGDALDAVFDPKKRADPEKFAAAIQSLSPAAQQAVLSIRALVPEFDALKNATQDSFFAGLNDQIQNLTKIYLPSIQNMTTGIAGAFNQMMTGIGNQLATPATQAQIKTTMDNITLAFQNAAPAAQSFSQAFIDIMQVGSEFLPGFGTGIANAAQEFANFIREARDSGQLKIWIQDGIDAVKALAGAVVELSGILYQVFGSDARGNIQRFNDDIANTSEILRLANGDTKQWGISWRQELDNMHGPLGSLRDGIMDIPEALALMGNSVKHVLDNMMTNLANDLNHMADILPDSVNKTLFGTEHPKPFSFTPSPDIPAGGDWGGHQRGPFGDPGWRGTTMAGGQEVGGQPPGPTIQVAPHQPNRTSRPDLNQPPGPPPGSRYDVPPPPPEKGGKKPSERDLRDQIIMGLDPALWRVDPFAPVPGQPAVPGLPQNGYAAPGYGVDQQTMLDDRNRIISEAHDLEEARKERLALERDNNASAKDIEDAKWKEYESGVSLQKAQAKLAEDMVGKNRKVKQGMDELSAALDPDLGLSKGLAGFADNLVRFLGSLALAGPMAKLNEIKNANEEATGIQGGYGLMGIMGAKNLAEGKSPLFGQPLPPAATDGSTSTYAPGESAYANGGAGGYMGDAALLAHVPAGKYSQTGSADLTQGLADCSSAVEDLVNLMDSAPTGGRSMATGNAAEWLSSHGFVQGMGGPGDFRVGFNSGHMQATLPGGTPFSWGSDTAAANRGIGGTGADDPALTSHFYRPGGAGAAGSGGYASMGGGGFPIPLPVTIVGGGAPGGGGTGAPGAPGGAAPPVGPGSLWDKVAQAESGGNWQHPDNGTGHFGGLQFSPQTWKQFGGVDLSGKTNPAEATREQQIEIANRTAFKGYKGSNPQGLSAFEAITKGMVPGVTARTPGSAFMTSTPGNPYAGPYGTYGQPPAPPGPGPLPTIPAGAGGGQGYMGLPAGPGAPPGPTQIGGLAPKSGTGEGIGMTSGGTLETAMDLAASAFPGVGQAAATGMKLASRAIQYGGQVAGIGMQGLMETFLPTGMSELANNSWLTRMVGALAGAAPALPNLAGKSATSPGPLTPEQVAANGNAHGMGQGQPPGPVQITYNNNGATEDRAGKDLAYHQERLQQPSGQR